MENMSPETATYGAAAAIFQFIIGLLLAMAAVYIGLKMFDKLTKNIDEWAEIK
jgi:hypothetical protein